MSKKDLIAQIVNSAAAERKAGAIIDIDFFLPYVSLTMSDGSEYFFQEHEASELLDKCAVVPEVNEADFILWQAQGW